MKLKPLVTKLYDGTEVKTEQAGRTDSELTLAARHRYTVRAMLTLKGMKRL